MNYTIIKSKRPNCKICGKPLKEWNPFVADNEHEHTECTADRISDAMMVYVKDAIHNVYKIINKEQINQPK